MTIKFFGYKIKLRKLYLPLYLFFFIFAPPMVSGVNTFHLLFFYTVVLIILKYQKIFWKLIHAKVCNIFYFGYMLLLLYVVILMAMCLAFGKINVMNEVKQLYRYFMVIIEVPVCAIYISIYCKKKDYSYYDLIESILHAGLMQSVFTILMVLFPAIKSQIVGFMERVNGSGGSFLNMSGWEYARRYNAFSNNLQDALGWGTGIVAALALFYTLRVNKKYFWAFLILTLVPLFNAVTGVLFIGVIVFFILWPYILHGNAKGLIYAIKILLGALIIASIVMVSNPFVWEWVKGNLLAIGKMGKGSSSSTSFGNLMHVSNWQFPESFIDIIIGTGHNVMGDAEGYHHADPGITNNIWLMGMIGTTYLYWLWFAVIRAASKRVGAEFKWIFISIWICLVLFEIKGMSNYYNPGLAVTECLVFGTLIQQKKYLALILCVKR